MLSIPSSIFILYSLSITQLVSCGKGKQNPDYVKPLTILKDEGTIFKNFFFHIFILKNINNYRIDFASFKNNYYF